MPEKTEVIQIKEDMLGHGSKEWVEYYLKAKAYKEREYKKRWIVN